MIATTLNAGNDNDSGIGGRKRGKGIVILSRQHHHKNFFFNFRKIDEGFILAQQQESQAIQFDKFEAISYFFSFV